MWPLSEFLKLHVRKQCQQMKGERIFAPKNGDGPMPADFDRSANDAFQNKSRLVHLNIYSTSALGWK